MTQDPQAKIEVYERPCPRCGGNLQVLQRIRETKPVPSLQGDVAYLFPPWKVHLKCVECGGTLVDIQSNFPHDELQ